VSRFPTASADNPDGVTLSEQEENVTMLPTTTDVVIVGAGPTGLTLAATLASNGTSFVLLDRRMAW
jgi:ribulose 1,5-bisphosphate synthetase/thiazole synthase